MHKTKRFLISMLTLLCCCTGAWAEGELNGVFTISAVGDKVQFSQGNLQYQASTNTWCFAANQYDYIGNAAGNTSPSSSQTAWIDFFNWGTSGYNHGANCYQLWSTSTNRSDYYAYGSSSKNLYDAKDDNSMRGQADWGYNAISNGGNTENSGWRILTKDEWAYLINSRSNTYRYAKGTIHGKNGMMLFPDGFTLPTGVTISNANTTDASYTSYSDETWTALEAAGVVFLPATGLRNGTNVIETGSVGNYWSSTCMNADRVYNIRFDGSSLKLENDGDRQNGFPVRLVKDYALQQDDSGNYLIGSVQDWKEFAELVNSGTNTAANARMTKDIDLGDDQTYISPTWCGEFSDKHYRGTFDGQGHTLTVHYNSSNPWHTPFSQTSGATIKNLHVAGTITSTSSEASHMSGLVSNSAGNDVIENVWVSAAITGGNNSWIECGAFVGCNNCGNTTITDCLFTGSITTTGGNNGCFAGWVQSYNPSSVTTTNCLSTGTFNFTLGSVSRGTINNSYVKSYPNSIPADMQITAEQLADGTIAYKLQAGREGLVWGQRLGTDSEPVLTNDESYRVYKSKNGGYTNDPAQAYVGLQQDASGNYLIGSVMDWQEFAELINTTPTANAKMTADIDLGDDQTMIGSGSYNAMDGAGNVLFKGTFDGQGHTLTINYSNSETFVAPFRHIFGATIKNIHVKGSITGSGKWLGGIVAAVFGQNVYSYLEKCYSSVSIISTNSPSDNTEHIGGIVAQHGWESNLSLTDCVFDGSLQRNSAKKTMSGLVGCYDGTIAISNSLHLGTLIDNSNNPDSRIATLSYRWSTHGNLVPENCYYKNALGEAQGTQATAEQLADGTIATALQSNRSEEVWVQDPLTNQPMLKLFATVAYKVPTSGIGTFSAKAKFTVPAGLTAHYCKTYNSANGTIGVVAIDGAVPANTGVVLKGSPGETYTLTGTNSNAGVITGNALVAVTEATHVDPVSDDYTNFMMSGGQFIRIAASDSSVKMPTNRAYLQILTSELPSDDPSQAQSIVLNWDNEATGIQTVQDSRSVVDGYYNLSGQRVTSPTKGLYVVGGRKVVIR